MEIINSAQSDSPPPALVISRLHVVGEIFNYDHSHSDFAINCPTPHQSSYIASDGSMEKGECSSAECVYIESRKLNEFP